MSVRLRLSVDQPDAPCTTGPFRVLGHHFAVRTDDPSLASYIDSLLDPFSVPEEPDGPLYSLAEEQCEGDPRCSVFYGPSCVARGVAPSLALDWLLWHIHSRAVSLSGQSLVLHAGAVTAPGRAILLPGPTGAGKTTLVAGLVTAGLGYLSDEAVPLSGSPPLAHSYAKPLSIKSGTQQLLPELKPRGPSGAVRYLGPQWHVPVSSIRRQALAPSCRPAFVIMPLYEPAGHTRLAPMTRADALVALIRNTVSFGIYRGDRGLALLHEVVEDAGCYQLTIGDLETACEAVLDLVKRAVVPAG